MPCQSCLSQGVPEDLFYLHILAFAQRERSQVRFRYLVLSQNMLKHDTKRTHKLRSIRYVALVFRESFEMNKRWHHYVILCDAKGFFLEKQQIVHSGPTNAYARFFSMLFCEYDYHIVTSLSMMDCPQSVNSTEANVFSLLLIYPLHE